ncbi:MAG: helix-turn-helix domain-containing protein [Clostridiales bacterium]|nr:helix-turn-helix domain-containing protein [Clostridiales bacterium]
MENINLVIGNNIKELRKIHKMTQNDLAEKLNYSNKAISRWESGEVIPDVSTLNNICDIFDIPITQIFEKELTKSKVAKEYKFKMGNRLAITLLSVLMVWLAAIVTYVYAALIFNDNLWTAFLWAVPISCVVGIVFNSIWGKKIINFILISIMIWSILACIYVTFLQYNMWLIFIIGVPIQIGVLLGLNIHRHPKSLRDENKN